MKKEEFIERCLRTMGEEYKKIQNLDTAALSLGKYLVNVIARLVKESGKSV